MTLRQDSPEWEAYRQSLRGIGASDAPAVLGLDPYRGPFDVWEQQTGRKPGFAGNKRTERGKRLEIVAAAWVSEEKGWPLIWPQKTVRDPRWPHLFCHPDRRVRGQRRIVQIKTRYRDYDEGVLPLGVQAQVQQEMGLTHTDVATVAVMTFEDLFLHELAFEPDTWEEMAGRLERWYVRHVDGDEPPSDTSESYARWLAQRGVDAPPRKASSSEEETARALMEIKGRIRLLKRDEDELEFRLKEGFGGAPSVVGSGWHITWPWGKGKRKVHWDEIAAGFLPSERLIEAHTDIGPAGRTAFRLWED